MTANKNESLSQAVVVAENGTSAINYRGLRDFDCGRHLDKYPRVVEGPPWWSGAGAGPHSLEVSCDT